MLLTFCKDEFKDGIIVGTKQQTIRADKSKRWKVGQTIHFWRGNPRNIRKGKLNNPHPFGTGKVSAMSEILMSFDEGILQVVIDDELLSRKQIHELVKADGFKNQIDFIHHFFPNADDGFFEGSVIHWKHNECNFYN